MARKEKKEGGLPESEEILSKSTGGSRNSTCNSHIFVGLVPFPSCSCVIQFFKHFFLLLISLILPNHLMVI
jgi:hypothetical protein